MGLRPPKVDDWEPDESILEGMRLLGASDAKIAAVQESIERKRAARSSQSDCCEVWKCNWPVVMAFLDVATQWMRAGLDGRITGLHYGNVLIWIDHHYPRRRRREIFEGLQVMERAALDALDELPKKPKSEK